MHTSTLTTVALLSTAALAMPANLGAKLRRGSAPIVQPTWVNDATGNLTFVFSDTTINFGTVLPSDVIGQLGSQCWDAGACDTSPYTQTGDAPASGGGFNPLVVTATVGSGAYPPWAHNGLVDAFKAAVASIQINNPVTYNRKLPHFKKQSRILTSASSK